MAEERVAAEVMPLHLPHAERTAKALQERGFRVLHVGRSISVDAPRSRWEETFGVSFTAHTKTVDKAIGRQRTYPRADVHSVRVPADLEDLVAEIAFMEPPELH